MRLPLCLLAAALAAPAQVTLHLTFDHAAGPGAVSALEAEVRRLTAGMPVAFAQRSESVSGTPVLIRFLGTCTPLGMRAPRRGDVPLAWTYAGRDGALLPFVRVDCDELRGLLGETVPFAYGRALGRLVAHELFHAVTGSRQHGEKLMRARLSASDLASPWCEFSSRDRARLAAASP